MATDETAPFVGSINDESLWDEGDIEHLQTAFKPRPGEAKCSRICPPKPTNQVAVSVIVVLSILGVILLALLVVKLKRENGLSEQLCLTVDCIYTSSEVLSYMNLSADPCDNFYDYACGGWEEKNEIPDTESTWGQFSILNLKNDNFLKKLMNDPKVKTKYQHNKAVTKAFTYHSSCMNRTYINQLGADPLIDLIEKYGSWNVSGNGTWDSASWDFVTLMVDIQLNLSASPFFTVYIGADYFNSTLNVIKLDQSGLDLLRDTYLVNRTDYEKIRQAYKKLMLKTVGLLGAEGKDVERQMMEIFDLETKIAKITIPTLERRNIEKYYKKMKIRDLANYTGNVINWKELLQKIFKQQQYPITDDNVIVVYALDYLRNVSQLYQKTPKTTVANYMMWRVIRSYMKYLSDDFKKISQEYEEVALGTKEEEPKWRQCLTSTAGPFGMPLGLMYVDEKFTRKSKTMVEELIREIRQVFIRNLDQVDWMDDETKAVAKDKAISILENIGYPEYLKNTTALEEKFAGLEPTDRYFENALKKSAYATNKNYAKIKKPVDSKEWGMDPQIVNAYYSFTKNKIVFPAGILQAPFYNKDRPRSLNYGGIGAVVGHEITHGFDDNGRRFNKKGNLVKWWSNHSIEAFTNKTKCLVKQYSKYKFMGESIKGAQTLGENIADNGGVKEAYQAYQRFVERNGDERILPGLNLTNDQLFFLGFSQVWCGKFRKQAALYQTANGVHTPGKYRVIGTLSNSEQFAKAYSCPQGSKMNPVKKCQVW